MIVLGSTTAEAGMEAAIDLIRHGGSALDAVEAGLRLVERAPGVHSVGQDAWPNLLGEHELDTASTRSVGMALDFRSGSLRGVFYREFDVSLN